MEAALPRIAEQRFHFSFDKKKRKIVLLHVCNQIVFWRVLWHRARGKNATAFNTRAIRYISCFEQCSLVCMNPAERCGTTHQRHSRSPRRGSRRESSHHQCTP